MVQVIKREWEIAKTYAHEVVMRNNLVSLDWTVFETQAGEGRPSVAVKADDLMAVRQLIRTAAEEIMRNINGTLTGVIIVIAFRGDNTLMMEEIGGIRDSCDCFNDDVNVVWGIQQVDGLANDRMVTIFAFEK